MVNGKKRIYKKPKALPPGKIECYAVFGMRIQNMRIEFLADSVENGEQTWRQTSKFANGAHNCNIRRWRNLNEEEYRAVTKDLKQLRAQLKRSKANCGSQRSGGVNAKKPRITPPKTPRTAPMSISYVQAWRDLCAQARKDCDNKRKLVGEVPQSPIPPLSPMDFDDCFTPPSARRLPYQIPRDPLSPIRPLSQTNVRRDNLPCFPPSSTDSSIAQDQIPGTSGFVPELHYLLDKPAKKQYEISPIKEKSLPIRTPSPTVEIESFCMWQVKHFNAVGASSNTLSTSQLPPAQHTVGNSTEATDESGKQEDMPVDNCDPSPPQTSLAINSDSTLIAKPHSQTSALSTLDTQADQVTFSCPSPPISKIDAGAVSSGATSPSTEERQPGSIKDQGNYLPVLPRKHLNSFGKDITNVIQLCLGKKLEPENTEVSKSSKRHPELFTNEDAFFDYHLNHEHLAAVARIAKSAEFSNRHFSVTKKFHHYTVDEKKFAVWFLATAKNKPLEEIPAHSMTPEQKEAVGHFENCQNILSKL